MTNLTPTRTVAAELRKAFTDMARAAVADTTVAIVTGMPSPADELANDIISVGRVTSEQDPKTFGPTRQFEEILRQQVTVSTWRPGGSEVDQVIVDRAFELLGVIEHTVRIDNTTVDGTVLWCHRTDVEFDSNPTVSPDGEIHGRVCDLVATFTAMVRIRN